MKKPQNIFKRGCSVLLALSMVTVPCVQSVGVNAADNSSKTSSSTRYEGEKNALSDEQYKQFGLTNASPEEFDPNDTTNPLEDYEPVTLSELYVGDMNRNNSWTGSFRIMNNTSEVSGDAFNFNNMDNDLIGNEVSFSDNYETNHDHIEVQTHNTCAIDSDGDGTDEILDVTLYVDRDKDRKSFLDVRVYDLNESNNKWEDGNFLTYRLTDDDSDTGDYVWSITASTSKSYTAMTAGDFDDDGKEEGAIYVPSKINDNAYIAILEANGNKGLSEVKKIYVSELNNGSSNIFDFKYKADRMPVVSLSTTSISGQDDLVISVSHPLYSDDDYNKKGHSSALGIYHYSNGKLLNRYLDKSMTSESSRMRFSSAVDADINGNGIEELIVGGYKNIEWDDNTDVGKLDSSKNLLQVIYWDTTESKYKTVWDSPREVEAHSDLDCGQAMTEPAALTAGRLYTNSSQDNVFLEGIVFEYTGSSEKGNSEGELLQSGSFTKVHSMELGGHHSAFISTASASKFSTAGGNSEQIVVLSGDHRSTDNDKVYYDIVWIWGKGTSITSNVTNNDYMHLKDEDDDGTFISICPLDVDKDAVYLKYMGKTYGWSEPELYCILQSAPYWQELQYNSESYGAGEVAFEVSYGNSSGTEGEWGVGLGTFTDVSATAGVGLFGNGISVGGGVEFSELAKYIGSYASEHKIEDSYETVVAPGEDHAVIMAIPVVSYNYQMWVPEYTVTQSDIDAYNKMCEQDPSIAEYPYALGQTVTGHWEECNINSTLQPSFSHMPLEEYNEVVEKLEEEGSINGLKVVTADMLAPKTIGDPSSYPHTEAQLIAPGNVENLHISDFSATTGKGEGEGKLEYKIEDETEESHGFELSLDAGLYAKMKAEVSLFEESEIEAEGGLQLALDGGASWISSSSKGHGFSVVIKDLPHGTSDDYVFASKLAVFNASTLPMGGDNSCGTYVVGHMVTGTDETNAPPKLPENLRIFATTESEVFLKWNEPDYRTAAYYEIYVEDNVGQTKKVGTTDKNYFAATSLDPGSTYKFAVKSYTEEGIASCMSRWITAITKESNSSFPSFTTQPQSVIITPEEEARTYTMTAEAKQGEGMEDAALTYQWQKYSANSLTGEGIWTDVEGATNAEFKLPDITTENSHEFSAETYYRVVATQTKGSNVKSVISRIATMFVNSESQSYTSNDLDLQLRLNSTDRIYQNKNDYYVLSATEDVIVNFTFNNLIEGGSTPSDGKIILMHKNADGTESKIAETSINGDISLNSGLLQQAGNHELYALYPGGKEEIGTITNFYYAAQSESITLHVEDPYYITYHLNGGQQNAKNPDLLTKDHPDTYIYPATKTGYTFDGWYLDEAFTQELADQTIYTDALTGDINLYAKYTAIDYSINYELYGGTNHSENPATYTIADTPVTLKEPTRAGYTFKGWYTFSDEGDKNYIDSLPLNSTGDYIVHADWEIIDYKIQYEVDGGENDSSNPYSYTVESDDIVLNASTKEGYEFIGWYSDIEKTQQVSTIPAGSTGDIILYAKWGEPAAIQQRTLTHEEYGVSVSGNISPDAQLVIEKLSKDHGDYLRMERESGKLTESWYIALMNEDGSPASWKGDLTIQITPESKKAIKDLRVVHLNSEGKFHELEASNNGENLIIVTNTLGSFGIVNGAEDNGNTPEGILPAIGKLFVKSVKWMIDITIRFRECFFR